MRLIIYRVEYIFVAHWFIIFLVSVDFVAVDVTINIVSSQRYASPVLLWMLCVCVCVCVCMTFAHTRLNSLKINEFFLQIYLGVNWHVPIDMNIDQMEISSVTHSRNFRFGFVNPWINLDSFTKRKTACQFSFTAIVSFCFFLHLPSPPFIVVAQFILLDFINLGLEYGENWTDADNK